jgi:hypothetical protein
MTREVGDSYRQGVRENIVIAIEGNSEYKTRALVSECALDTTLSLVIRSRTTTRRRTTGHVLETPHFGVVERLGRFGDFFSP